MADPDMGWENRNESASAQANRDATLNYGDNGDLHGENADIQDMLQICTKIDDLCERLNAYFRHAGGELQGMVKSVGGRNTRYGGALFTLTLRSDDISSAAYRNLKEINEFVRDLAKESQMRTEVTSEEVDAIADRLLSRNTG